RDHSTSRRSPRRCPTPACQFRCFQCWTRPYQRPRHKSRTAPWLAERRAGQPKGSGCLELPCLWKERSRLSLIRGIRTCRSLQTFPVFDTNDLDDSTVVHACDTIGKLENACIVGDDDKCSVRALRDASQYLHYATTGLVI